MLVTFVASRRTEILSITHGLVGIYFSRVLVASFIQFKNILIAFSIRTSLEGERTCQRSKVRTILIIFQHFVS